MLGAGPVRAEIIPVCLALSLPLLCLLKLGSYLWPKVDSRCGLHAKTHKAKVEEDKTKGKHPSHSLAPRLALRVIKPGIPLPIHQNYYQLFQ